MDLSDVKVYNRAVVFPKKSNEYKILWIRLLKLSAENRSMDYGNNLNSLIEFNLTSTPEPSTWALMAGGAGLLGVFRTRRKT